MKKTTRYKNILISGGAGFIGSHLVLTLLHRDYHITVLDNLSKYNHISQNITTLFHKIRNKITFIKGDVRNKNDWLRSLFEQDVVVHLAAEIDTYQSLHDAKNYVEVNIGGTFALSEILLKKNLQIKKIVLASSRAVYGEGKYVCNQHGIFFPEGRNENELKQGDYELRCPKCNNILLPLPTDEKSPINPVSIYAITKHAQEQIIISTCRMINIPFVIFRYQNVYGPWQYSISSHCGILSTFSKNIKKGIDINIFEDGLQSRDFVYIDDVIDATILGIEKEQANKEIFNVGTGKRTSIARIADILIDMYKSNVSININQKYREGDIRHNYADINKICNSLNFKPKINLENGIIKYIEWSDQQKIN